MDKREAVARAICGADGYTHPDEDWRDTLNGTPQTVMHDVAIEQGKEQRWRNYLRAADAAIAAYEAFVWPAPTEEEAKAAERNLAILMAAKGGKP